MEDYHDFIHQKSHVADGCGFEPVWMPDFLFDFQTHITDWAIRRGRSGIFADCGMGKGQSIGSKILTTDGFVRNDKLKIGDLAISSDGRSYPVIGIYYKKKQPTYKFSFSDGSCLVVDEDHLHIIRTNNDRQRNKKWRVLSTKELLGKNIRYGKNGKSKNYDVPVVRPIDFSCSHDSVVSPYVLGVLLGDGSLSGNIAISSADQEIIDRVRDELPPGVTLEKKKTSKYDYRIKTGLTGNKKHPFRQEIKNLGLLNKKSHNKFIPDNWGIHDNRIELLRGLMDTDGYIMNCGTSQYYSVSKALAIGVRDLVRSLGGIPTLKKKKTQLNGVRKRDCYIVTFSLNTMNPFYLSRKAVKWNPSPRDNGRWLDRIDRDIDQPTICISVASPDQSYVTDEYIVTHNTPMQLVWAENIARKTNGKILVLTPLAVSRQTIQEGEKFGIEVVRSQDGTAHRITVSNYERLHYFNPSDFVGVVCDESSCLKAFDGKRRKQVTRFLSKMKYRLLCTATAAPNDYIELGTASEALGELTQSEMLGMFFRNSDKKRHTLFKEGDFWNRAKYFFKAHSEIPFWRWVCSWARAIRMPSDLGYDDGKFILPELIVNQHVVKCDYLLPGEMYPIIATTLAEQRAERKATINERCEMVKSLIDHNHSVVVWCQYNPEGDLLEKMIPDAIQVAGADSDQSKEDKLMAFTNGDERVLITKPKIGAWGLNWQHCGHHTFFPSHSFEQWYQAVRRSLRFGRVDPVTVDIVTTEGEAGVTANLMSKQVKADTMFKMLVNEMNNTLNIKSENKHTESMEVPEWL